MMMLTSVAICAISETDCEERTSSARVKTELAGITKPHWSTRRLRDRETDRFPHRKLIGFRVQVRAEERRSVCPDVRADWLFVAGLRLDSPATPGRAAASLSWLRSLNS